MLLSTEVALLRRCVDWLTALEREEWVVEDLLPITEVGKGRVLLDPPKVVRILSTIAADLDELAGRPAGEDEERLGPASSKLDALADIFAAFCLAP